MEGEKREDGEREKRRWRGRRFGEVSHLLFFFAPPLKKKNGKKTQLRHGGRRRARPGPPRRLRRRSQEGCGFPQADRDGRLPRRGDASSSSSLRLCCLRLCRFCRFCRLAADAKAAEDDNEPGLRRRHRCRRPDGPRRPLHGRPRPPRGLARAPRRGGAFRLGLSALGRAAGVARRRGAGCAVRRDGRGGAGATLRPLGCVRRRVFGGAARARGGRPDRDNGAPFARLPHGLQDVSR